jgi:hypothetical protein
MRKAAKFSLFENNLKVLPKRFGVVKTNIYLCRVFVMYVVHGAIWSVGLPTHDMLNEKTPQLHRCRMGVTRLRSVESEDF